MVSQQQNINEQQNTTKVNYMWQYKVYPGDSNFSQRNDKKNDFIDHDNNQNFAIETEFQEALKNKFETHSFLLSGNFSKFRNNNEYAIVFEDTKDQNTWYKTNTTNFRIRPIRRVHIKNQIIVEQAVKNEDFKVKRWAEKKIIWQYKVFTEDLNYKAREDQFMHYVNHDPKQSAEIEKEYNLAKQQGKKQHQFVLSGDWEKDRCKWEYEILFEDIDNQGAWFKQNTITKKKRPICRIEIWQEVEERLEKMQKLCLEDVAKKSKKESDYARPFLIERCQKLGIDLSIVEKYIQYSAPIIVHIHLEKYMKFFVKDIKYRNQFETGSSSGSQDLQKRKGWEQRMFENYYDQATGGDRPKYGVINITNNPLGDYTCRKYGYGNDFLELKNEVRNRCTITSKDSSYDDAVLGTLFDCCHVLFQFTDEELLIVFKAAQGKQDEANQFVTQMYKEVQIHGPLEFEKDVLKVNVSNDHKNNKELTNQLNTFKIKFNIQVKYIDGEPDQIQQEKLSKIEIDPSYGND